MLRWTSGPRDLSHRSRAAAEATPRYEYQSSIPFVPRDFVLIWTTAITSLNSASCRRVHRRGREVIQRRMEPLVVVEPKVTGQARRQRPRRGVVVKVDALVLHRMPQTLHEHVVHPTAA